MKKNLINGILVLLVAAVLTVLALYVRPGVAADAVAVMKTNGMTCGSCSEKISKALQRQNGVAATEVDVAGGWVVVGYDSTRVKPEALAVQVAEAGFASNLEAVLTPEQFRQITGREIGQMKAKAGCGGCGPRGGCGQKTQG